VKKRYGREEDQYQFKSITKEEDNMKRETTGKLLKVFIMMLVVSFMVNGVSLAGKSTDNQNPVNINRATVKELSSLPGIGKKRAEAIIAYREKNGKFSTVEDIRKVEGIGKDTLEKIKDHIVLE
jgi:competence protein ComEA